MAKKARKAKAKKAPKEVKKLTRPAKPAVVAQKPDPVVNVNEEHGPQTGAPVHTDLDEKVRQTDLKRSRDQLVELAPHSDEAVVAAGLSLKGYDEKLVGLIAAVPADGATGTVGWVTARKIAAAIKGK